MLKITAIIFFMFSVIIFLIILTTNNSFAAAILIKNGTIITVTSGILSPGDILIENGKILQIGAGINASINVKMDVKIIDAKGKFVLPGFVDTHSHIGVSSFPFLEANQDANESTDPITPHMRVIDAINVEDPAIKLALKGGVTTVQVLPGSANLIGGQSAVIKLRPNARRIEDLIIYDAPKGMKMALGENPKQTYGRFSNRVPKTRMGNMALLREVFQKAQDYKRNWETWEASGKKSLPPSKDLKLEALRELLDGQVRLHVHCYRVDDIGDLFRLADEFKFKIASLQHALEAYKIADDIARRQVGVATFADKWGFKEEAWDAIPQAPSILAKHGVKVSIQTDHPVIEQRWLALEAAKTIKYGMPEEEALKSITINPAWMLGLESKIGSLEPGKDADIVIWSGHPFKIKSLVEKVFINGEEVYSKNER